MKPLFKKCCYYISLGKGCVLISLTLIFFELLSAPIRNAGPVASLGRRMAFSYRLINVIHVLGCVLLIAANYSGFSFFVWIFLVTNFLHIVATPVFLIADIFLWHSKIMELVIAFVGVGLSVYFWLVAYSFYYVCKNNKIAEGRRIGQRIAFRDPVSFV